MNYQLPPDSLFADTWNQGASAVADVPEQVKAQIREEAVLSIVNRLEASLRLLLYATTPGKEPPTADHCRQILNVWRYELEHRIHLTPDTYCGAVQRYDPEMDEAYSIIGRCQPGDLLRIRVPCWRMYEKVVIRGEAELVESVEQLDLPLEAPRERMATSAPISSLTSPGSVEVAGPKAETAVAAAVPEASAAKSGVGSTDDLPTAETGMVSETPPEHAKPALTMADQEVFAALSVIPATGSDADLSSGAQGEANPAG